MLLITVITNFLVFIGAAIYVRSQVGVFYWNDILSLSSYLACYVFYFVSLAVLASTIASTETRSLFLGIFFYTVPLLFILDDTAQKLNPYNYYKNGFFIMSKNIEPVRNGILLFLSCGLIFLALSMIIFNRRDL